MSTDISSALIAKSDQLNADDLIGGPIIIEITKVTNLGKGKDQPIIINYVGDAGHPYKPCKGMGRVMSLIWETTEGTKWLGRKVQIFRNPEVIFAGEKLGGIQISHMSHITEPKTVMITKTRGHKVQFTVQPLLPSLATVSADVDEWLGDIASAPDAAHLEKKYKAGYKVFKDDAAIIAQLTAAKDKRKIELTACQGDNNASLS